MRQDEAELTVERREIAQHIPGPLVLARIVVFPAFRQLRPDVLEMLPRALGHRCREPRNRNCGRIPGFDAVLHGEADRAVGIDHQHLLHPVIIGDPGLQLVRHEGEFRLAAVQSNEPVERARRLVHRPLGLAALLPDFGPRLLH